MQPGSKYRFDCWVVGSLDMDPAPRADMIPGNLLNSLPRLAMGLGTVIEDIQTPLICCDREPPGRTGILARPQEPALARAVGVLPENQLA
jgi:hypothetical protein